MIKNMNTLRAMEKRGLIKLHADTGQSVRHWTGQSVKSYYIDEVYCKALGRFSSYPQTFTYKNKQYSVRYLDGCFCPFVFAVDAPTPAFA